MVVDIRLVLSALRMSASTTRSDYDAELRQRLLCAGFTYDSEAIEAITRLFPMDSSELLLAKCLSRVLGGRPEQTGTETHAGTSADPERLAKHDDPELAAAACDIVAQTLMRQGKPEQAMEWVHRAESRVRCLGSPPVSAAIWRTRAQLLEGSGDHPGAQRMIADGLQCGPVRGSRAWAYLMGMQAYYAAMALDLRSAEQSMADLAPYAHAFPPRFPQAIAALGAQCAYQRGDAASAVTCLESMPHAQRVRRVAWIRRLWIEALLACGRAPEAAVVADEGAVDETAPDHERQALTGLACLARGDGVGAARLLHNAALAARKCWSVHRYQYLRLRVLALTTAGSYKQATSALRELDPAGTSPYLAPLRMRIGLEANDQALAHTALSAIRAVPGLLSRLVAQWPGVLAPAVADMVISPQRAERCEPHTIIGSSAGMQRLREQVAAYAAANVPVLIRGETGSGKELVASSLHRLGPRSQHPFVALNCGALGDSTLESELFGHCRGSFTGADRDYQGLLISAGPGTVFLDEVQNMSPRLQMLLLRVLEDRLVRPLGSTHSVPMLAQVHAASNLDLANLARTGSFRADLYYRLVRFEISVPPLRERRDDIPALVQQFASEAGGDPALAGDPTVWSAYATHPWTGNVRELRNLVGRLIVHRRMGLPQPADPSAPQPVPQPAPQPIGPVHGGFHSYRAERTERLVAALRAKSRLRLVDLVSMVHSSPNTVKSDLRILEAAGSVRREVGPGGTRTGAWIWDGEDGPASV